MQRNPRHKDKIQIGYNTRYHIRRDGRKRLGPRSPGRLHHCYKAETDINTCKPANNPSSSKRAGAHLRRGRKDCRATQSHRPAATKLQGEAGAGSRPRTPPPRPRSPQRTQPGVPPRQAQQRIRHGVLAGCPDTRNSIGTAGQGGVNNSGALLAYTASRKDEASSHRLQPPRALTFGVKNGKPVRERHRGGRALCCLGKPPACPTVPRWQKPASPACPCHQRERSADTLHSAACSLRT